MFSFRKIILSLAAFGMVVSMTACRNDAEVLQDICGHVEEASKLQHDCDKMADVLEPEFTKLNQKLDAMVTTDNTPDEQEAIIKSLSVCTSALFVIKTGSCGDEKRVKDVLGDRPVFSD